MRCIVYILLVFLLSCSSDKEFYSSNRTIKIDRNYEYYNATDIFKEVEFIPLQGDKSTIGSVDKIEFKDDGIYLLDKISHSIFVFKVDGNLTARISRRGRGHGEYLTIDDFIVDVQGNILILDGGTKSILTFDKSGAFVKKDKIPFLADAFEFYNDNIIVFSCNQEKRVRLWNIEKKVVEKSYFSYNKRHGGRVFKPIVKNGAEVYYKRMNDNDLYAIDLDDINVAIRADFGKNNLNSQDLMIGLGGAYYPLQHQFTTGRFTICDSYFAFMYQSEEFDYPFYAYVSNTSDSKIIVTKEYYNDNLFFCKLPLAPLAATADERMISAIEVGRWIENMNSYKYAELDDVDKARWEHINSYLLGLDKNNTLLVLYKPNVN